MARLRALATTSVAAAAVGIGVLGLAAPASADPSSARTYAGVGSDTIQDVMNAAAGDVSGTAGVFAATAVGSWNAFGSATIVTKPEGPEFTRPAGSTEGRRALYASVTGGTYRGVNIANQVDFARSSSYTAQGASGTSSDNRVALYVPFARDGVSYAYKGAAAKLGKLTTAQLQQIYTASGPTTINGVAVTGLLPQAGSGTRSFWLSALGLSESTIGSGVRTVGAENDGRQISTNTVIPFSAAQFVSQANGVQTDLRDSAKLGAPNGKVAYNTNANTGQLVPNANFYNSAPFGRSVYNVIDDATATTALRALFINSTRKAPLCTTNGLALTKKYGFAPINTSLTNQTCGVAVQGAYPTPTP